MTRPCAFSTFCPFIFSIETTSPLLLMNRLLHSHSSFILPTLAGFAARRAITNDNHNRRGIDPNEVKPGREGEGFPSGGASLMPNLSIVPVDPFGLRKKEKKGE